MKPEKNTSTTTRRREIQILLMVVLALSMTGCEKTARAIWKDILAPCSESDLIGKDVVYFGPSNTLGVGSVWRKRADGGYALRWKLAGTGFVEPGGEFVCSGKAKKTTKIKPSVVLGALIAPVTGSISAEFDRARDVTVSVESARWEQIVEGPFEAKIREGGFEAGVINDLKESGRYVLTRGLVVKGLKAQLTFDSSSGLDVKGKLPAGDIAPGSENNPFEFGIEANWTGNTTLSLVAKTDVYIAGQLSEFRAGGLAGPGDLIGPPERGVGEKSVPSPSFEEAR